MQIYNYDKEQLSEMTMLEAMQRGGIFGISEDDNGFEIYELCDENFAVTHITKAELMQLGEEIIALAKDN